MAEVEGEACADTQVKDLPLVCPGCSLKPAECRGDLLIGGPPTPTASLDKFDEAKDGYRIVGNEPLIAVCSHEQRPHLSNYVSERLQDEYGWDDRIRGRGDLIAHGMIVVSWQRECHVWP